MKNKSDKNEILKIKNLSKSYHSQGEDITVLSDLTFSVNRGEILAIMGPSGVGKSTLLNLVGTIDKPDDGEVFFNGKNPFLLSDSEMAKFRNKNIGFVFQFHHLLPEFTALENVYLPSIIYEDSKKKKIEKARQMLDRVGLTPRLNHKPSQLSGGERQRVAVARALINNPYVILGDEPSGNLDLENSKRLIDLLFELNDRFGNTFILATHNPNIAERCHRTINLKKMPD
ncbi:MAG: ABC transporter ATP-binding protein [Candidatus Marinimicrobia bacterium]|nr:ABC transporter ATP-binding protein [Candidatus Neomarinimicrobiota bacterium]